MPIFLQLAPEMGGLTFGPFDGIVNLGSDPKRCQVVLDSNQGVYPLHAILAPATPGVFHLSPTDANARVFVIQTGSPQVWPVTGAVQVNIGDSIVLGTPGGPRFMLIERAATKDSPARSSSQMGGMGLGALAGMFGGGAAANARSGGRHGRSTGMAQGIGNELQRQAEAKLMRNPLYRNLYTFRQRARTGGLINPVTIVGTLFAAGSMLMAGTFTCTGFAWSLWRQFTF